MSKFKLNYRYARPDAPLPLLLLDKIIRSKYGFVSICFLAGVYNYYQTPIIEGREFMAFMVWATYIVPSILWIFEIRKHGLVKGSRQLVHVVAGVFEKKVPTYSKKVGLWIHNKIKYSFAGKWYRGLPKNVKILFLPIWYGIPAAVIFFVLKDSEYTSSDAIYKALLQFLFPNNDFGGLNPVAIVFSGIIIIVGLLHIIISLEEPLLWKLNPRIHITLTFQR